MILTIPNNSLFVDTSGWADPVLRNTADHAAMEVFYKDMLASARPLVTTSYVMAELVALLTARPRVSRAQILQVTKGIRHITQLRTIYVDQTLDDAGWDLLDQHSDKDWSLTDAVSFVLMRQHGLQEAFTSDHHFAQAGFTRLPMSVA